MKGLLFVLFAVVCPLLARAEMGNIEIIGGVNVDPSDPIAATTVAVTLDDGLCTGSIIDTDLVVTAGHCVGDGTGRVEIVFTPDTIKNPHALTVRATGTAVPPEYKGANSSGKDQYDIALIHFAGGLPKGYGKATLMSPREKLTNGETVTLAGYGIANAITEVGAGVLRKTQVTIAKANFGKTEVLLDQTHGSGACHGDSGGPAFVQSANRLELWGVTNRGYPDHAPDDCAHQAVYTNILAHTAWLADAAQRLRKP